MFIQYSTALLSLTLLCSMASPAAAKPGTTPLSCASASGIKTEAEVALVPSQNVYTVNVTFLTKRPSDKEVDRVLRNCVTVAVKRDGTKDILGSPWLRKRAGDNPNDDDLLHPYGGLRYLSYDATSKEIGIRELKLKKKSP